MKQKGYEPLVFWKKQERDKCWMEIDEEMLEYQILDGLTENDYIAFPDELTQEGMEAILPDSMENGENQGDAGNAGAMNVME